MDASTDRSRLIMAQERTLPPVEMQQLGVPATQQAVFFKGSVAHFRQPGY